MQSLFTPQEREMLGNMPESDIIELAAELGVSVPAVVRREELMERVVHELACHVRAHGLPLSQYDAEDVQALSPIELRALADLAGVPATVDDLLKAGKKVYKSYTNKKATSPIPLMVPTLLAPLARYAASQERS